MSVTALDVKAKIFTKTKNSSGEKKNLKSQKTGSAQTYHCRTKVFVIQ